MLPPFCWLGFAVGDVAWRGPAERTERPMRNSPRANRSRRPVLKRNVLVGRTEDREQKWIGRHFFKKKFAPTRSSSSFCCLLMKKETSFKWQFLLGFLCPLCVCVCVCVCVCFSFSFLLAPMGRFRKSRRPRPIARKAATAKNQCHSIESEPPPNKTKSLLISHQTTQLHLVQPNKTQ